MTVEQLNQKFAIPGKVKVVEGKGGFPIVEVTNEKAVAKISVYSGQVISFKPAGEPEDLLFLSDKAYYQTGKAIKGGIPICWPWFGPDPEGKGRASHGFVRNRMWTILSTEAITSGETKIQLGMSPSEETLEIWPHQFELVVEVLVGAQLSVTLITKNTGDNPFSITQALHTYFATGGISQVRVLGFKNAPFVDKAEGGLEKTQTGDITITAETDRIYTDVRPEIVVEDGAMGRRIGITSTGSSTAIVWNPWKEISVKMADLEDQDYQRFICVETANAEDEVIEIAPGAEYKMQAVYTIERS
ncbi:MAG: D-hexose-6-phosphate mutarotase [Leptolyngbya foveolarum]|uniref:Putative glucose-6-phosphate 1-epimerase n=1 Tax=Leptolyngbya foveolarum TaxID=47253 RepID=A0A2W4W9R7_9CYAN|nr:MAG: D-hexose-6-phosphate mutarotase [Leptolyngbya foveolarum]